MYLIGFSIPICMVVEDWWRSKIRGGAGTFGEIVVFERSTILKNQLSQLVALNTFIYSAYLTNCEII